MAVGGYLFYVMLYSYIWFGLYYFVDRRITKIMEAS